LNRVGCWARQFDQNGQRAGWESKGQVRYARLFLRQRTGEPVAVFLFLRIGLHILRLTSFSV